MSSKGLPAASVVWMYLYVCMYLYVYEVLHRTNIVVKFSSIRIAHELLWNSWLLPSCIEVITFSWRNICYWRHCTDPKEKNSGVPGSVCIPIYTYNREKNECILNFWRCIVARHAVFMLYDTEKNNKLLQIWVYDCDKIDTSLSCVKYSQPVLWYRYWRHSCNLCRY